MIPVTSNNYVHTKYTFESMKEATKGIENWHWKQIYSFWKSPSLCKVDPEKPNYSVNNGLIFHKLHCDKLMKAMQIYSRLEKMPENQGKHYLDFVGE